MFDVRTVGTLFTAVLERAPAPPLLTYYDDATGERTELSAATLGNWVAKTANTLVDDLGLGIGGRAACGLPPHWMTAAVLLACWRAGLAVTDRPEPADVAFVAASRAAEGWPAGDRYALGLHPFALPLREVPDGFLDFTSEVRVHGDFFTAPAPVGGEVLAWYGDRESSHAELCDRAAARATALGIGAGDRVMIDVDTYPDPLDWLVAPLAAGASTVLCRNADALGARTGAERVTVTVT
jgi:uncharacterized protein (TIGR03089 family)